MFSNSRASSYEHTRPKAALGGALTQPKRGKSHHNSIEYTPAPAQIMHERQTSDVKSTGSNLRQTQEFMNFINGESNVLPSNNMQTINLSNYSD
jgi:hypothetical protein